MITSADVIGWLDNTLSLTPDDTAVLDVICAAVEGHFAEAYEVPEVYVEDPDDETALILVTRDPRGSDIDLALTMQAARLWKRRRSPEGVIGFGDAGVVRIGRYDADISEFLAPYRTWCVGI